ncbi:MAG: HAD hydrolase family protein [Candidatus Thorarchaeota archaeon]|jgi:phosphoserine phosphatase
MKSDIKIISLDLDGVLFDGPSATLAIAHPIGLGDQFVELFEKMVEEEMNPREVAIEGAKIWKGIPVDATYHYLIKSLPLMEGAAETIATLRGWGYEVGCISGGVSQYFMEPLTRRLNLDFAYSNILGSENGAHDGTIQFVMGGPEKVTTIWQYAQIRGHPLESIASVGNGLNDIDLFKVSAFSIAFNPVDQRVSDAATETVVSKDLRSILPYFERL